MTSKPTMVAVSLRWADMDAMGHVNNVQFLRLLEEARVRGFHQWFGEVDDWAESGLVVTRNEIEYHRQLAFRRPPVTVEMWVTRLHSTGFDLGHTVRDSGEEDSTPYAIAQTGVVFLDAATGRSRTMGESERRSLEPLLGAPVPFRWRSADD